jgi:hypothetical protein
MNTRYILGKPIWEKTNIEGEAYALLSFFSYGNVDTNTMLKNGTISPPNVSVFNIA